MSIRKLPNFLRQNMNFWGNSCIFFVIFLSILYQIAKKIVLETGGKISKIFLVNLVFTEGSLATSDGLYGVFPQHSRKYRPGEMQQGTRHAAMARPLRGDGLSLKFPSIGLRPPSSRNGQRAHGLSAETCGFAGQPLRFGFGSSFIVILVMLHHSQKTAVLRL